MSSENKQKSDGLQNWRTLSRRPVLQTGDGKFLKVEYHTVELPDGVQIEEWPWVITPDFVNVVAQTVEGTFICFRQTKYAVTGETLAVTGGYLEPGEEALYAGQRELLEESGYAATDWTHLGQYAVDGNRGAGTAHLYLARNAEWRQPINADDLEEQRLQLLTLDEMTEALLRGDFKVVSWATAVAMALVWIQSEDADAR